jgi:hypothetical protein
MPAASPSSRAGWHGGQRGQQVLLVVTAVFGNCETAFDAVSQRWAFPVAVVIDEPFDRRVGEVGAFDDRHVVKRFIASGSSAACSAPSWALHASTI